MIPPDLHARIAEFVIQTWVAMGISLGLFCWLNVPVLLFFTVSRLLQLRDPNFELRATTPTHHALNLFCTAAYGFALPGFYVLSVRTRGELGVWRLGPDTNSQWTILLTILCMGWIAAHLLEAAARLDHLRFGPGWIDRGFAALGLGLCLWFHFKTLEHAITQPTAMLMADSLGQNLFTRWVLGVIYPQSAFLGATLVFGFALAESIRAKPEAPARRRWWIAVPLSALLVATLFAPFWLSIPRVTHEQAINLLDEHRGQIVQVAQEMDADPRLLAGIIYVAHTRDHPRWTGDLIERIGLEAWSNQMYSFSNPFGSPLVDPSVGLCQIRPVTAIQTLDLFSGNATGGNVRVTGSAPLLKMGQQMVMFGYVPWQGVPEVAAFRSEHVGRIASPALRLWLGPLSKSIPPLTGNLQQILAGDLHNLRLAALMIRVLQFQWREAGYPIYDRPDILATLYNIGYERSYPHAEPKANDFGRRVAAFMDSEDCRRLFPAPPQALTDPDPRFPTLDPLP
jgi:hypothetical protein